MSLLWKWWKESPEYIAAILIALVLAGAIAHSCGKEQHKNSGAVTRWRGEVADAIKF